MLSRETDYEVEFDSKRFSVKEKMVWTWRIWKGYKGKIKMKLRTVE